MPRKFWPLSFTQPSISRSSGCRSKVREDLFFTVRLKQRRQAQVREMDWILASCSILSSWSPQCWCMLPRSSMCNGGGNASSTFCLPDRQTIWYLVQDFLPESPQTTLPGSNHSSTGELNKLDEAEDMHTCSQLVRTFWLWAKSQRASNSFSQDMPIFVLIGLCVGCTGC